MALDLDLSELVSLNVVVDEPVPVAPATDETAPPEEAPRTAEFERVTLGCVCDTPTPRGPTSALCAECGLVYMASHEYSAFLAERRAEVERVMTRVPETEPAAAEPQDPAPRRRLLRRRRQ